MFDYEQIVDGIEVKTRQLRAEVQRLRTLVDEREEQLLLMEDTLREKEKIINKLTEENKIIRLGNRLAESNDSTELKLKINQMIRAVDRSLEVVEKWGL